MTPTTRARLLSRTALALGWLALALVATVALADDPPQQGNCDSKLEQARCPGWTAAIPAVCTSRDTQPRCTGWFEVGLYYDQFKCIPVTNAAWDKVCYRVLDDFDESIRINCYTTYPCVWNAAKTPFKCNPDSDNKNEYLWEKHAEWPCIPDTPPSVE